MRRESRDRDAKKVSLKSKMKRSKKKNAAPQSHGRRGAVHNGHVAFAAFSGQLGRNLWFGRETGAMGALSLALGLLITLLPPHTLPRAPPLHGCRQTFVDLSWNFRGLSGAFVDLSWNFRGLSGTFRGPFVELSWTFVHFYGGRGSP